MKSMEFAKMDGAGNDFVVVADVPENDVQHSPEAIRALCDRRRGIGADGVLILKPLSPGELKMAYYNSDGSSADLCGNGLRCAMEFAAESGFADDHAVFHTGAGRLEAWRIAPGLVRIQMPLTEPFRELTICGYPVFLTSCGVPHAIVPLTAQGFEELDVEEMGRSIRFAEELEPEGANVDFVLPVNADTLRIRTYERGVEAETLACGTGAASAGVYAWQKLGGGIKKRIICAGGDILTIELTVNGNILREICLSGPARTAFTGVWNWN